MATSRKTLHTVVEITTREKVPKNQLRNIDLDQKSHKSANMWAQTLLNDETH